MNLLILTLPVYLNSYPCSGESVLSLGIQRTKVGVLRVALVILTPTPYPLNPTTVTPLVLQFLN